MHESVKDAFLKSASRAGMEPERSGSDSGADSGAETLTRFRNQARQRALERFSVVLGEIITPKI